ncbi:hypothetical protein PUNSTDRAFT_18280, partial [Punctularia strigosozonata HHB-11173 SS5]|uniref:uncharacterized protein n=1 Tax=Punctularia strigosozonata (strain HHB-11173) TaxID=741275 RepID=UPI0004417A94
AIVTDSHQNSALECWRLSAPFATSSAPGTTGASELNLGGLANATYTVFPARFDGGVHNGPFAQYVIFTSGLAVVTLPHNPGEARVAGGPNGLIVVVDTVGSGHITTYPSDSPTIAYQIPFQDGIIPAHKVLHAGACTGNQ